MSRDSVIEVEGIIKDVLSGGKYLVEMTNGLMVTAKLSGNMKRNKIKTVIGDRVRVAVSPYDLSQGRIVYRNR